EASRETLLAKAFQTAHADESHRARLRVEIGRLRASLKGFASVSATRAGFSLTSAAQREVGVLAPPVEDAHATLLALLADGEAWSSSALAMALGVSQRTVQRALDGLAAVGKVHAFGRGRAKLWTSPPVVGFATTLLLPGRLPSD
ncbi:MAG TPA: HTH domain-containing protein, partial [Polyangiaceae bacterium]